MEYINSGWPIINDINLPYLKLKKLKKNKINYKQLNHD